MKTRDRLRKLGIHNPHEFYACSRGPLETAQPYIDWTGSVHRADCAKWRVYRPGFKTNPEGGHWSDFGNKCFVGGRRDASARDAAINWAGDRYKVDAWMRDPFGSWGPADFVADRLRTLGIKIRPGRIIRVGAQAT